MVDRHYSLNLKPLSGRTLYVYVHADLPQKYSVGLQEILSPGCVPMQEVNSFFLPFDASVRPIKNNFQFFIRFFEKRGAGGRILIFFIIYFLTA